MPVLDATISRRSFFRFAAGASALAAFPIVSEAHLAWAQRAHRSGDPNKGVHIDSNENPMGPCDTARQAIADLIPKGGRYYFNMEEEVVNLFAQQEGLDPKSVRLYAGSSEPLAYTVLAFTSPSNPLVTADPGYEAAEWSAKAAGAPVLKIALSDPKGAAPHDIRAMLAASPSTGVIYICNPNNPTGTCTPRADIEYAVDHAPKNTILLIDEAYIHFCDQPRSLDFVKEGRNVIVLRTFSKIYGMAGLRMGFAIGRPDLLKKLDYFGRNMLPTPAMFGTRASLLDTSLVSTRKAAIASTRTDTTSWLKQQGYAVTPSESNCFMVDTRRPAKDVIAAMAAKEVYIGRPWPSCPTQVRITVGLPEEMMTFRKAFTEVMTS
ncbi:MAG TPA: pyridoxal phosphate-dependent aminotransferase [Terracidiphilus sp.]|jgi:histidinol-phosphate aminotransferase|nr:pyridoxal phosphate-dependent aminotransferase [Terracidiphilus sp.]